MHVALKSVLLFAAFAAFIAAACCLKLALSGVYF